MVVVVYGVLMEKSSEVILLVVLLKRYFYWYNVGKFFWPELTFLARTRPAGRPRGERNPTRHVPSY